jgi:hypothetical protein
VGALRRGDPRLQEAQEAAEAASQQKKTGGLQKGTSRAATVEDDDSDWD